MPVGSPCSQARGELHGRADAFFVSVEEQPDKTNVAAIVRRRTRAVRFIAAAK